MNSSELLLWNFLADQATEQSTLKESCRGVDGQPSGKKSW